jgi:hypothetical protein
MRYFFPVVGCALIIVAAFAATASTTAVCAKDLGRDLGTPGMAIGQESDPETLRKTYKRRCTNFKCKKVSESTQSIFKCPFCGSSTVPVT